VAVLEAEGLAWSDDFPLYEGPGSSYHGALFRDPQTLVVSYSSGMFRKPGFPQFSDDYNRICARTVHFEF
jgi:hypothetical protein